MGGFPCVNLSMLTSTPGSVVDASCESGKGFLGLLAYCRSKRPSMVIMENVNTMFSKRRAEGGSQTPRLICKRTSSNMLIVVFFLKLLNFTWYCLTRGYEP